MRDRVFLLCLRTGVFLYLFEHPRVYFCHAVAKRRMRRPPELLSDEAIVGVSAAHTEWPRYMTYGRISVAADVEHHLYQIVDGYHFLRADVDRLLHIGLYEALNTLQAFVDIEERARLIAVTPNLDVGNILSR